MNRIHFGLMTVLCLLVGAGSARAACPAPAVTPFLVEPAAETTQLPGVLPNEAGAWATVIEPPRHGSLTSTPDFVVYSPASSFWTLGADRARVRRGSFTRVAEVVTVHLVAKTARAGASIQTFEGAVSPQEWPTTGSFEISSPARLAGNLGLAVTAGGIGTNTSLAKHIEYPGGSNQGSGGNGGWRPPGGGGGGGSQGGSGFTEATLLSLSDPPVAWVRMRQDTSGLALRLETPSSPAGDPWLPISAATHQLKLLTATAMGNGHAQLYLDGKLLATVTDSAITPEAVNAAEYSFGLGNAIGDVATTHFDQLSVFRLGTAILNCSDSFEATTLAPEWGVVGAAALALESPGLSGNRALAVSPHLGGSPAGGLVTHSGLAPLAMKRLGLRVSVDPKLLNLAPGASVLVTATANQLGTRAFRVLIDGVAGGGLQMRVIARPDSVTAPQPSAAFPLAREPQVLEVDWTRSETDVDATGTVRLWLDGVQKAELLGIHNPTQTITEVGFGALTIAGAPSGKLLLDDIDFWYEN